MGLRILKQLSVDYTVDSLLPSKRDSGHKPVQLVEKMSKIIFGFFFFF